MKTIKKNDLDEVIELVKKWALDIEISNEIISDVIEISYKIARETGIFYSTGIYDTLHGVFRLNKEATNEQIYSVFKVLGYEVK